jgi:hypothetical protein
MHPVQPVLCQQPQHLTQAAAGPHTHKLRGVQALPALQMDTTKRENRG